MPDIFTGFSGPNTQPGGLTRVIQQILARRAAEQPAPEAPLVAAQAPPMPGTYTLPQPPAGPAPEMPPVDIASILEQFRTGPPPGDVRVPSGPMPERSAPPEDARRRTLARAPQEPGYDPERRARLLQAARQLREGTSRIANIPSPAEIALNVEHGYELPRREAAIDIRAAEERTRQGDLSNPRSPASRLAQQMYSRMTGQPAPEGLTAQAFGNISPVLDNLLRTRLAANTAQFRQMMAMLGERRAQRGEERERAREEREEYRFGRERGDIGAAQTGDLSQLPEETRKAVADEVRAFRSNSRINDLKSKADASQSIRSRMEASETFGPQAAFRAFARAAGEVGVMTDKDIQDFRSRLGALGLLDRINTFIWSELPERLKEEMFKVVDAFAEDSRRALEEEVNARIESLKRLHPFVPEELLRGLFMSESQAETEPSEGSDGQYLVGSDGKKYPFDPDLSVGSRFRDPQGNVLTVEEIGGR